MPHDDTAIKINWLPKLSGKPGSNFFVKYRIKGTERWFRTKLILDDDYTVVENLTPNETYEFKVVSVDGDYETESDVQDIATVKYGRFGELNKKKMKFREINSTLFFSIYSNKGLLPTSRFAKFVVGAIVSVVVLSIIGAIYFYVRYRRMSDIDSYLKFFEKGKPENIDPEKALNNQAHLLPYNKTYEFPQEKLHLDEKPLGEGQFGIVYKAIAEGILPSDENGTTVAVKMIKKIDERSEENQKLMKAVC